MSRDTLASHETEFLQYKVCVLIPTYNNAGTLAAVINSVSAYTRQIVVVNDGSTDDTASILQLFPYIRVKSYIPNRGKGHALMQGFRYALELGYQYAITIDSDGQHYASDLPSFLTALHDRSGHLIIGARNMDQAHIPGKSSFGNKFSNFWFWVETGIRLPDTQSGYRLYPLNPMRHMRFFTRKYEFEIETPVRLAWKRVPVSYIPVSVYYPPADERISHFRPFKDFARISVLNTVLTFWALLWIHPRNLINKLRYKSGWKDLWQQLVVQPRESNQRKAASIAFGIFMGIFPVWGFQLAIGIPLSIFFRLNKALFLLAANISIFPVTPIFWAMSVITGKIILGYDDWSFRWQNLSLQQFKEAGFSFFLGGAVLATVAGALAYIISLLLLSLFRKKNHRA